MKKYWFIKVSLLFFVFIAIPTANAQRGTFGQSDFGSVLDGSHRDGEITGEHSVGLNFQSSDLSGAAISPTTAFGKLTALGNHPDAVTRGAKEAKLYAELSPRVVMVVTNDSLGSGAVINDAATILTNWHVVEGYRTVGVIYKPRQEGKQVSTADIRKAVVVRIDEVSDLALLRVEDPPKNQSTFQLGNLLEVPVGSDVHAIGHPTGESWTYTRGIVSQMRREYEWYTESGKAHKADVIQTQTPINPGNSGGPLISDNYKLVGVNSFSSPDSQGLNFAVSVDDVRQFLTAETNRYADDVETSSSAPANADECKMNPLGSERAEDDLSTLTYIDLDCDGEANGWVMTPDDPTEPEVLLIDSSGDGKLDTALVDLNRDGEVDESYYDVDADGSTDLVGYHKDGNWDPYRWENYEG